ncbi:hypothetical protein ACFYW6_34635 [Streptomyces sp. NPDC002659]|uniref:hypothetical protein n=1 Tax=Streptomyces sp. NPDC002659 TaxID=3364656 RepID=UPI003691DD75
MKRVAVPLVAAAALMAGTVACTSEDEHSDRKATDVKAFKEFAAKGQYGTAVQHVAKIDTSKGDVKIITDFRAAGYTEQKTADNIASAYLEYRGKKGMWNEISVTKADGTDLIVLPAGD